MTSLIPPTSSRYSTVTAKGTTKIGLLPVHPLSNGDPSAVPLLRPELAEVTDLLPTSLPTGRNAGIASLTGERRCLRELGPEMLLVVQEQLLVGTAAASLLRGGEKTD